MILELVVLAAAFVGGVLVGRKSASASVAAEIAKIEATLSADEKAVVAKIKALLHIS